MGLSFFVSVFVWLCGTGALAHIFSGAVQPMSSMALRSTLRVVSASFRRA